MKKLAHIISRFANPLLIPIPIPFIIVYSSTQNPLYAAKWQLFTLVFLGFVAIFILYGMRKGFFSNFDVSKRKQRNALFLFGVTMTLFYLLSIFILQGPVLLILGACMILMAILMFSIVNTHIKASFHVATASALIVSLILVYGSKYYWLLFVVPLIAWSRVILKRHTVREVIAGGILGSFLSIITYILGVILLTG